MNTNKIKLIGRLLAHRLGFKYVQYIVKNGMVDFIFTNKEGFRRCYATSYSRIKEYCYYTNCDIMHVLFN